MKRFVILLLFSLAIFNVWGQDITGQWNGVLTAGGTQLRLVFHISHSEKGYSATMDSPDQGAKGIPVTNTRFENSQLKIELINLKVEYTGEFKDTVITGTFKQAGMSFPLDLKRKAIEKKVMIRPQEPKEPFPYYSEEVTFENEKDHVKLAGTLTLPQKAGKFPVVILITGSGPQNRNEEVFGHKPFLVLSDHLTRNGIAVLRFDDRGTNGSKGDFKTATTKDFASDVESAFNYLISRKEINRKKIGLIGHSEGGIIAPMVAAKMKKVGFIVLLAGTSIRGNELLLMQQELIQKASGMDSEQIRKSAVVNRGAYDMILRTENSDTLKTKLSGYFRREIKMLSESGKPQGMSDDDYISMIMAQLYNPWMLNFMRYDPAPVLEKVKCPVLALNGEKDLQVPPKVNLEGIKKGLEKGGNKKVTIRELPGLNHLFQECKTGLPAEYGEIEQTISPAVLTIISTWINSLKR